jgi:hypothetical protein
LITCLPAPPVCLPADSSSLSDSLAAFIKAEKLPAFTEFSQETSSSIFGSGINHQVGGWMGGWVGGGSRQHATCNTQQA